MAGKSSFFKEIVCELLGWFLLKTKSCIKIFKPCKKKVQVIPRQAELAQGVLGSLRPQIFLTFRHYKGGRSSAKCTGCLYPRRNPWYSLSEAESTSGHVVLSGEPRKRSPVTPPGIVPGAVRLVAQCLNHYATPGPLLNLVLLVKKHLCFTCKVPSVRKTSV